MLQVVQRKKQNGRPFYTVKKNSIDGALRGIKQTAVGCRGNGREMSRRILACPRKRSEMGSPQRKCWIEQTRDRI